MKYRDDLASVIDELIDDVRGNFQVALARDNEYSGTLALAVATSDVLCVNEAIDRKRLA